MSESEWTRAATNAIACNPKQTPTQAVRELRGFSQTQLAQLSGVSVATIDGLECGAAPDVLLLGSVARALSVKQDLLER